MQTKHLRAVVPTRPDPVSATCFDDWNDGGVLLAVRGTGPSGGADSASAPAPVATAGGSRRLDLPDADSDPVPPRRCGWNADYL